MSGAGSCLQVLQNRIFKGQSSHPKEKLLDVFPFKPTVLTVTCSIHLVLCAMDIATTMRYIYPFRLYLFLRTQPRTQHSFLLQFLWHLSLFSGTLLQTWHKDSRESLIAFTSSTCTYACLSVGTFLTRRSLFVPTKNTKQESGSFSCSASDNHCLRNNQKNHSN